MFFLLLCNRETFSFFWEHIHGKHKPTVVKVVWNQEMGRPGEGCHVAGCYVFLISAIHLSTASVLLLETQHTALVIVTVREVLKQIISRKSDKHVPSPTSVCVCAMVLPKQSCAWWLQDGKASSCRKWEWGRRGGEGRGGKQSRGRPTCLDL